MMDTKKTVAASILSVKEKHGNIQKAVEDVEPFVKTLHVDIMDGKFVRERSFEPREINALKTSLKLDIHLMVAHPRMWFAKFLHPSTYFVHVEASDDPDVLIRDIRDMRVRAGIVLNPDTPARVAFPYLKKVHAVLVMSVHPGKGGQRFLPSALQKIRDIRARSSRVRIVVDGGINLENMRTVLDAGASQVVMGSALWPLPAEVFKKMREVVAC